MATIELLTGIYSSHAIYLERVAATLGNDALPYLESIEKRVAKALDKMPKRALSTQETKDIRNQINDITREELQAYTNYYKDSNKEVGIQQAAFDVKTLDDVTENYEPSAPSAAAINSLAVKTPIKIGDNQFTTYNRYVASYWKNYTAMINDSVAAGFITGATNREIAANILEAITLDRPDGDLSKAQRAAKTMARTGTNHYSTQATVAFVDKNDEVLTGYRFIATLDNRTSRECSALDQRVFKKDANIPYPPLHPNALVGGSMITTSKGQVAIEDIKVGDLVLTHTGRFMPVTTVMCKLNDTNVKGLVCRNGSTVRLTDDHPVLTLNGWKVASDVNVGDELFYNTKKLAKFNTSLASSVEQAVLLNSHNIKTSAVDELVTYGIFSGSAGMSSSVNLNGHISNAEVTNKLTTNDLLKLEYNSSIIKSIENNSFVESGILVKCFAKGSHSFSFSLRIVNGVVSLHSLATSFVSSLKGIGVDSAPMAVTSRLWGELLASVNGVLTASGFNSKLNTSLSDSVVREIIFSLNEPEALPKTEMLNLDNGSDLLIGDSVSHSDSLYCVSVISVVDYTISGYVYNISVAEDETYYSGGLLVHNCRSRVIYEIDGRYTYDDSSSTRPSNFTNADGKREPERVSSKDVYYQELKSMSAADRNAILGPQLGPALSKMNSEQFAKSLIDSTYNPLTIAEMKKKDNELGKILRNQSKT